jgi:transcriptional regulator with XRE-family HTH domain
VLFGYLDVISHPPPRYLDDPVKVGGRVKALRHRAGLTLRELSFPGCTAPYLSLIERGARTPSLHVLVELGQRLGVSAHSLGYGTDDAKNGDDRSTPSPECGVSLETLERAAEQEMTPEQTASFLASVSQLALIRGQSGQALRALRRAVRVLSAKNSSPELTEDSKGEKVPLTAKPAEP